MESFKDNEVPRILLNHRMKRVIGACIYRHTETTDRHTKKNTQRKRIRNTIGWGTEASGRARGAGRVREHAPGDKAR